MRSFALAVVLCGCVVEMPSPDPDPTPDPDPDPDPDPMPDPTPLADVRCDGEPAAGPTRPWRHTTSTVVVALGAPHHRGIDVVATSGDATQSLRGKITYGPTDKDLEDEDIDLFACSGTTWQPLGTVRTDTDGKFELLLAGDRRLAAGLRDLYLSVAGDRTGARFLALVAPATTHVVASDVDGTLTSHENAYPESLALGGTVAPHPGAATALASLASRGYAIVYITARGDRFTQDTRDWFAANGFPRGALRMPTAIITLPGDETIAFKSEALAAVAGFDLQAGIGNRATDVAAYATAGLPPERILIKLPEFADELADELAAGAASPFTSYDALRTGPLASLP